MMDKVRWLVFLFCIIDIGVGVGITLWHGRNNELGTLEQEYVDIDPVLLVTFCVSDIMALILIRSLFLILIYTILRKKSVWPSVVVCIFSALLCGTEILICHFYLHKEPIEKWVLLGISQASSFFFCFLTVLTVSCCKPPDEEYERLEEENAIRAKLLLPPKTPKVSPVPHAGLIETLSTSKLLKADSFHVPPRAPTSYSSGSYKIQVDDDEIVTPVQRGANVLPSFPRMVALMVDPVHGVSIQDRKGLFKTYKSCFTGSDLVSWMLVHLSLHVKTRAEALEIALNLMRSGYVESVSDETSFKDDDSAFYRLTKDVNEKLPVEALTPMMQYYGTMDRLPAPLSSSYPHGSSSSIQAPPVSSSLPSFNRQPPRPSVFSDQYTSRSETTRIGAPQPRSTPAPFPSVFATQPSRPSRDNASAFAAPSSSAAVPPTSVFSLTNEAEEAEDASLSIGNAGSVGYPSTSPGAPVIKAKPSRHLSNFVNEMRDVNAGIRIRDHTVAASNSSNTRYTTYHNCFQASELVDWLMNRLNLPERPQAVKIAQKMIDTDVIVRVIPGPAPTRLDGPTLLRFQMDS